MDNYPNLKQLLNTSFRIRHLDFSDANIEFHFIDMTPYPESHQPNTWIILIPCHSAASVDINRFIMAQTTVLDVLANLACISIPLQGSQHRRAVSKKRSTRCNFLLQKLRWRGWMVRLNTFSKVKKSNKNTTCPHSQIVFLDAGLLQLHPQWRLLSLINAVAESLIARIHHDDIVFGNYFDFSISRRLIGGLSDRVAAFNIRQSCVIVGYFPCLLIHHQLVGAHFRQRGGVKDGCPTHACQIPERM